MKKSIFLAAILLSTTSAFASKARVNALQGADHVIDSQSTFTYPSYLLKVKPFLTFEFGAAGTDAEGGLVKTLDNGGRLLFYVGHKQSTALINAADLRTGNGYLGQTNPIEVMYGMGDAAYGISLSTVDNKKSKTKETTATLKYGISLDPMNLFIHLTPVSTAEKANGLNTDKITSTRLSLGANAGVGNYHYFGSVTIGDAKNTVATVDSKIKDLAVNLGVEDRSLMTDISDIYYGAMIQNTSRDVEGKKITAMQLPVFIGIEHSMTSWAVVRASVAQNLLVGSTKDETATATDAEGIPSNTTAAAGLGLMYGKVQLDGTLSAASNGQVNGSAFLTQASLTYNF